MNCQDVAVGDGGQQECRHDAGRHRGHPPEDRRRTVCWRTHVGSLLKALPLLLSEVESVVTAAVTFALMLMGGCGVDLGCGVGYFAEAVEDLVALMKRLGGFVACGAGRVGGGEVVFDALDGGGRQVATGSPG